MKNLTKLLVLLVLGFSSCDKINDLNTKEISNVEISETVTIQADVIKSGQVKSGETDVPFSKTITLDLSTISEIQKYMSHLEDMDITSLTCKITDLGEGLISKLQVTIPSLDYTFNISPLSIDEALKVSFTSDQLNEIANSLLEDKSLVIILSGTVEQAETFNIETTALANIEVEIL
ncbi:hypothetical protein [Ancylomarina sp. 16SWW S1-10-2]|uniref:hypothetical protein n=1 Tax=Ancylomarina sp. 16SWW S1-10-2 TaxID=2499681 RepID=UPI0012ADCE9D|nr:hypothetical protein [Ancylomarina sp. 16SWW S1-10-2]MRT93138.1 hypothetical protein [Ancylomarina sp. 16SWW S1-10-2]